MHRVGVGLEAALLVVALILVPGGHQAQASKGPSRYVPRTAKQIEGRLEAIMAAEVPSRFGEDAAAAVRTLNAYRYLAGSTHDVELDDEYTKKSTAACTLFAALGRKSHDPKNPGWPARRFDPAAEGARNSNIGGGAGSQRTLLRLIHGTMFDSDPSNVWQVGHRRWNLNPRMARTGFGTVSGFQAMWSTDYARKDVPDFEFVAWPPPGLVPVAYWEGLGKGRGLSAAWSVHLHPKHYKLPSHGKPFVRMWAVKKAPPEDPKKFTKWLAKLDKTKPIELAGTARLDEPFAWLLGVVWLPHGAKIEKGRGFWVDIGGLLDASVGIERPLRYYVEGM